MSMRSWRTLVGLGFVALATGCSSGAGRPVQEVQVAPDADGVQRVSITAHSFWFEPNRVVVHAGHPVEVRVKNGGPFIPHNLTCDVPEAGIHVNEGLGMFWDGEKASFTPTKAGEYPFYCDKDSHAKKGMKGTLVVLP